MTNGTREEGHIVPFLYKIIILLYRTCLMQPLLFIWEEMRGQGIGLNAANCPF